MEEIMKNRVKNLFQRFVLTFAMVAALIAVSIPTPVAAAGSLTMSTSYPGITVSAGDTVSFDLDFDNETGSGTDCALSVTSIPTGWTGYFSGSSKEISNVYVKTGEQDALATYALQVPDDAAKGSYKVVLKAAGSGASSSVTLNLTVNDEETGLSSLTTDYAEQEGASGTAFTFTTTIQNNTADAQSYSLTSQAADGWTVAITPSGESTQVASIDVDAKGTQALTITITPPSGVTAGDYTIPISAISASDKLSTDLKVTITGTYGMTVATPSGTLSFDATANKKKAVTLDVTNSGNIDLTNVNLTASAPDDWTVEFSESTIDTLAAGQTKEVTMNVTPSENSLSGDYEVDVTAKNDAASQTAAFRVTVKTATSWGIVGVVLIAAVIGCLVLVFRKFGRH